MRYTLSILFVVALLAVGCGDSLKPKPADDAASTDGNSSKKKATTFTGTWMVTASRMDAPREVHIAVIEITRSS